MRIAPPIERGPEGRYGQVYLTFDDGPHPEHTPAICDLLEQRGHRATFFMSGCNVTRSPDVVSRVVAGGHAVGSHSYAHLRQWERTGPRILADYARGHLTLAKVVGSRSGLFRPPYGHHDWRAGLFAKALRLDMYGWSGEGKDWEEGVTPAEVLAELGDDFRSGDIYLLHDAIVDNPAVSDRTATVDAVGLVLDRLEAVGLRSAALPGGVS